MGKSAPLDAPIGLSSRRIFRIVPCGEMEGTGMKVAIVALALSSISSLAIAQERAGDAALGALSGAVVLGPIGAVAGAVVGYTAGPSISRSWGRRSSAPHPVRRSAGQEARSSAGDSQLASRNQAGPPTAAQAPAATSKAASNAPPVQGLE